MRTNELTHHGILGMHWGVRKAEGAFTRKAASRQEKADRARKEQATVSRLTAKTFNPKINNRQRSANEATRTAKALRDSNHPTIAGIFDRKATNRQTRADRARGEQALASKLVAKTFDSKISRHQRSADEAARVAAYLNHATTVNIVTVQDRGTKRWRKIFGSAVLGGAIGTLVLGPIINVPLRKVTGYGLTPYGAGLITSVASGVGATIATSNRRRN